jgi:hypothetical protein
MIDYKDQLDRAGYALRDKVGQVLSSGSRIVSYRDRAAQYAKSGTPQVVTLANAVTAKANGLLANYRAIESDSLTATGNANALRAKMETDPTWKAILNNPTALLSSAGWGTIAFINKQIQDAGTVVASLASLTSRSNSHLEAVSELGDNVRDLENFAQGKGLSAKLAAVSSFGSGVANFANNYLTFAKYAAIAVGVFFVWDMAKPLLAVKRKS